MRHALRCASRGEVDTEESHVPDHLGQRSAEPWTLISQLTGIVSAKDIIDKGGVECLGSRGRCRKDLSGLQEIFKGSPAFLLGIWRPTRPREVIKMELREKTPAYAKSRLNSVS